MAQASAFGWPFHRRCNCDFQDGSLGGIRSGSKLSVAKQWNEAVQKFGFEPVYPPIEDIQVGDVFAMITHDAVGVPTTAEPFAGRSIKLIHLDMTSEIEDAYRAVYQFPLTIARPGQDGVIWQQTPSTESLFKVPATRTALPIALFPSFTISSSKRAGGSVNGLIASIGSVFDTTASSTETIEVRFSGTETYGIPAVPAESRLIDFCAEPTTQLFCTDQGMRQQLAILIGDDINDKVRDPTTGVERMRFSVELSLVSRVFLARSIRTSMSGASGTRGNLGVNQHVDLPELPSAPISRDQTQSGESPQPSAATTPVKPPSDATSLGAAIAAERRASSNLLLPDTVLPRPIVVGFKSVRFRPVR